jgi:hypothetical protein
VLTDVGPVEVKIPRDTLGTFEPQIVKKRRLTGLDEMVLMLSAKGLTHGEISAHLYEVYGTEVSKQDADRSDRVACCSGTEETSFEVGQLLGLVPRRQQRTRLVVVDPAPAAPTPPCGPRAPGCRPCARIRRCATAQLPAHPSVRSGT